MASQALPKLCAKYYSKSEFTSDIYSPRYSAKQMKELEKRRVSTLSGLFEEKKISWWDVYDASDIGEERGIIASRYITRGSSVLDVGCGRGFFSFACARRARHVVALDLMNGKGRSGWWAEFSETSRLLEVSEKVFGTRGSAAHLPFGEGSFDAVTAVHAIRNFNDLEEIKRFLAEARRVLKKGGRVVLVESDLDVGDCRAYRAFYDLRIKVGWESKLPLAEETIEFLRTNGFSKIRQQVLDSHLKYAPVYFPFDRSLKGMEKQYRSAKRLLVKEGEKHPPVLITTASR
jgi:ubiquinone/menaquinone biosynthesis C-methylase UbiE